MGFLFAFIAIVYGVVISIRTMVFGVSFPGYASIVTWVCFLSGLQMISLGLIGEYIGRMYMEAKLRPAYIIEDEY